MKAKRKIGAFTLIEILVSIGIISILGGTSYVATQNLKQVSDESKLEHDVAQINNAIQIYQLQSKNPLQTNALGTSAQDIQNVLATLQTRADSASAAQTAGLKGSVLDERVEAPQGDPEAWQSAAEAASNNLRAYWDPKNKVFYTSRTGAVGIKKFKYNDAVPAVLDSSHYESRTPLLASTASGWVWSASTASSTRLTDISPTLGGIPTDVTGAQDFAGGYWTVGPTGKVFVSYAYREAGYNSVLGLFDLTGMGPDVYNLDTPEGQRQFLMEALRRVAANNSMGQVIVDTSVNASVGSGSIKTTTVENGAEKDFVAGDTVAAILIPNGSIAAALAALQALGTLANASTALQNLSTSNGQLFPLTSLSRTNAATGTNTDFPFYASQYASLGAGSSSYAIEDTANNGDKDYQDLVFKATGMTAPSDSLTNTIDPIAYYSTWLNPSTGKTQNILNTVGTLGGMTLAQALLAETIITQAQYNAAKAAGLITTP